MNFDGVQVYRLDDGAGMEMKREHADKQLLVEIQPGTKVTLFDKTAKSEIFALPLESIEAHKFGEKSVIIKAKVGDQSLIFRFLKSEDSASFLSQLSRKAVIASRKDSVMAVDAVDSAKSAENIFDERTEEASSAQYFQFYGYLSQQQNMLQDYVRTATYQKAIFANAADFRDKVVLDVGAGSGILSFFAVQAGARRVYAVEASSVAEHCRKLVKQNDMESKITVLPAKIEEIALPEEVDIIISEPMGYMLVNERMLETFLHARKFLKSTGVMFPSRGELFMAPFSDEMLYMELSGKAAFWTQENFYGVNLTSLKQESLDECFAQPVVDTWHPGILLSHPQKWTVNFDIADETSLHKIEFERSYTIYQTGYMHGLAFWFDVLFVGASQTVYLSTGPTEPLTHWYQVRCLFRQPVLVHKDQETRAKIIMTANRKQSYDVYIRFETADGSEVRENTLDLKTPYFRYTGQPVHPPPGQNTSPTESYWSQVGQNSTQQQPLTSSGINTVPAGQVQAGVQNFAQYHQPPGISQPGTSAGNAAFSPYSAYLTAPSTSSSAPEPILTNGPAHQKTATSNEHHEQDMMDLIRSSHIGYLATEDDAK